LGQLERYHDRIAFGSATRSNSTASISLRIRTSISAELAGCVEFGVTGRAILGKAMAIVSADA
jgi:hypothetical protein